ncbi:unnamed protein product, partial [Ectocarpus sp. 12 AP-2014]
HLHTYASQFHLGDGIVDTSSFGAPHFLTRFGLSAVRKQWGAWVLLRANPPPSLSAASFSSHALLATSLWFHRTCPTLLLLSTRSLHVPRLGHIAHCKKCVEDS